MTVSCSSSCLVVSIIMVVGFGGWTSILSYGVGLLTSPSEFRPSFWGCDSCGAFCGVAREKGVDPGWMRNPENLLSINGFGSFCIVALYTNSLSWASCSFPKCSFRVTFKSGLTVKKMYGSDGFYQIIQFRIRFHLSQRTFYTWKFNEKLL